MFGLHFEALGAHVAAAKVHVAVFEAEHDDHAFAIDEDVVAAHRRILAIGATAIEDAVQILRHRAVGDLAIAQVGLEAAGRAESLVNRNVRKAHRAYG